MLTNFKEENAMTETTTTTEEHAGEAAELGLCIAGAATDRRCWRRATERDIGEREPTLCPEHMIVRRRGEDLDARLHALEATPDFLGSEAVEHDPHTLLRELAIGWLDAINDAFSVLIDRREPSETKRLVTISALKVNSRRVNEEYEKFRREQGLGS
jgi:hypothetical protein